MNIIENRAIRYQSLSNILFKCHTLPGLSESSSSVSIAGEYLPDNKPFANFVLKLKNNIINKITNEKYDKNIYMVYKALVRSSSEIVTFHLNNKYHILLQEQTKQKSYT